MVKPMLNRDMLHEYQLEAIEQINTIPKSALWLQMGLGKTISTLTAITDLRDSFTVCKVLVIAPLRVCNTVWEQESNDWEHTKHLTFSRCIGKETDRIAALLKPADVYLINRENTKWLCDFYGKKGIPFDMVVIDESSSFKSSSSQRFKALRKQFPKIDRMVQLTGTPSVQGYMDVWSQLALLDNGERLLRTMTMFKKAYFDCDYMGYKYELKQGADITIQKKIEDIVLSMKTDGRIDMPDRVNITVPVVLSNKLMKQYKEFQETLLHELESGEVVEADNAAVVAGKLLQFANSGLYDEVGYTHLHSAKLDALAEIIEDNPDENILVGYNFKFDREELLKRFPTAVVLDKAGECVPTWNAGGIKLLITNAMSASQGLNLQKGGSLLVWYGLTWSLETYLQFNARLHRQGQKETVRIVHIVTQDTIDERVLRVLGEKDCVQESLLRSLDINY